MKRLQSLLLATLLLTLSGTGTRDPPIPVEVFRSVLAEHRFPRPIEPRLSVDGAYQPCPNADTPGTLDYRCSGREVTTSDHVDAGLAREILALPRDLHSNALKGLIFGSTLGSIETSIDRLEAAFDRAGPSPDLAVDLSAAYLARFKLTQDPLDLMEALEATSQKGEVADGEANPRILFNRALAATRINLPRRAAALWRQYLEMDSDTGWADEARLHLEEIESALAPPPVIARDLASCESLTDRVQELSELAEKSLAAWAQDSLAGNPSQASLDPVLVGTCLKHLGREPAMAQELLSLPTNSSRAIAEGHRLFAEGRKLMEISSFANAIPRLRQAESFLSSRPFCGWARFWLGAAQFGESDYEAAIKTLTKVTAESADPALRGRAQGIKGLAMSRLGRHLEAHHLYRAAVDALSASGRKDHQAWAIALLAENLTYLGLRREAQEVRAEGLGLLPLGQSDRSLILLIEAAKAALDELKPATAKLLTEEAQAEYASQQPGDRSPLRPPVLSILEASALVQLGRPREALERLEQGTTEAAAIVDAEQAQRTAGLLALSKTRILAEEDPAAALELLNPLIQASQERKQWQELVELYDLRAKALDRLGRREEATREVDQAIDQADTLRKQIAKADFHRSYARFVAPPFERKIAWAVEGHDFALALELLDRKNPFAARPEAGSFSLQKIKVQLPQDSAILIAHREEGRLLLWCLDSRDLEFAVQDLDPGSKRLLDASFSSDSKQDVKRHLEGLWSLLIKPLNRCANATRLIFVADPVVAGLPLAALVDPETGRYLIEDHIVSLIPSLGYLLTRAERPPLDRKSPILLAGADQSPAGEVLGLKKLAAVEAELAEIAALFTDKEVLTGQRASPEATRSALKGRSIFHFSGHARSWGREAEAMLFFAGSAEQAATAAISVRDLAKWPIANLRLVYLSACSTLDPRAARGDGLAPFAEVLLGSAKVDTVVGSVKTIPDDKSRRLAVAFYRSLLSGKDAAASLREAQLQELQNPDPKGEKAWASLLVFTRPEEE